MPKSETKKIKTAIVGATGYTGAELVKILLRHPHVELSMLCSEQYAGKSFNEVYTGFGALSSIAEISSQKLEKASLAKLKKMDLVFFATPNGIAHKQATELVENQVRVIDLSADFRFRDLKAHKKAYGFSHESTSLNKKSIYGLVEFKREDIKKTKGVIANPGCYTTASILALTPLLQSDEKIDFASIIIDAKSGVSGAGRKAATELLFTELNESVSPYKLAGQHRHAPELEEFFSKISGQKISLTFSPHLMPMDRGLLATCYVKVDTTEEKLRQIYKNAYDKEAFVELLAAGLYPNTKAVRGTNKALVQVSYDKRLKQAIITCAIDNLVKGAAGQAVQNMNLIFGFEESLALL